MGPSAFPVWRGSNSVSSQANHLEDGRGRCLLNLYCYIAEGAASTGSALALRQRWYTRTCPRTVWPGFLPGALADAVWPRYRTNLAYGFRVITGAIVIAIR